MSSSSSLQWLSLIGVIWLQSINGTNTDFPAYSSQLKNLLSLSQLQLNFLAFASDAGKLFGWLSGFAAEYLPLWLVLMIGATLGLIGYGVQYLFLGTQDFSSVSYCYLFLLTMLAGNSICWINTVCYAITIKNFPYKRQTAVGLSTSYAGLSAKIYTDLVDVVPPPRPNNNRARTYLLLNAVLPLIVSMGTAPLFRDVEGKKTKGVEEMGFLVMFMVTAITGIYAVISSLGFMQIFSPMVHAIGLAVFLAIPLVIPLTTTLKDVFETHPVEAVGDVERGESEDIGDEISETADVMEEIGWKLMLQRVNFWLYFFVYMCGATLGMVYLNNLGQIAESLGLQNSSSLVALASAFGFFGRLGPSLWENFFCRSKYTKPAAITVLMIPMAGAFLLLLHTHTIALYLSTAVIGVCTGAISSIAVSTTTELFGTKNFNVNHNILVANIPLGSLVFGYIAALLYQKVRDDQQQGEGTCMGEDCYRETFLIWGTICTFGTLLSFILYFRTRRSYVQKL